MGLNKDVVGDDVSGVPKTDAGADVKALLDRDPAFICTTLFSLSPNGSRLCSPGLVSRLGGAGLGNPELDLKGGLAGVEVAFAICIESCFGDDGGDTNFVWGSTDVGIVALYIGDAHERLEFEVIPRPVSSVAQG